MVQGVSCHFKKCLEETGASNQRRMFGYATDETLSHVLATKLRACLTEVHMNGTYHWLWPDGKTKVTIEYQNDHGAVVPIPRHTVLFSIEHDETVINDEIAVDLKQHVIKPVFSE